MDVRHRLRNPGSSRPLAKAKAAGASILAGPYAADHRNAAIVQFPGGYIAEIHDTQK